MNKLREVLRLKLVCNLSNRKIARAINASATTIGGYVNAAKDAKLDWSTIEQIDDISLSQRLEPFCKQLKSSNPKKMPIELQHIHLELKRHKGMTLLLLHEEYCSRYGTSNCYSYREYCRRYRAYKKTLKPSMRNVHVVGEKVFVDYAGPKVAIQNPNNGEITYAVIFIGVLGASNFTFAEATLTRSMEDWLGSHVRMYEFFGGVPEMTIPDNEKSGVKDACYYDPELNPQYAALAEHYQTVVLPTRPGKPKDKAKVEAAVLVVERWILARLRDYTFFSLDELNQAIKKLLVDLNQRPLQKLPGSRLSNFEETEKSALKSLPKLAYEFVVMKKVQVKLDYHIEVNQHNYSVPHQLIGKGVHYKLGQRTLEIYYQSQRIASHIRDDTTGTATTLEEHMPMAHLNHQQWTPEKFLDWANNVGVSMTKVAERNISERPHPEWCYRSHLGFINLAKRYSNCRLEAACEYALKYADANYKSIKSILKTQIDQSPTRAANETITTKTNETHEFIRGTDYYT